MAVCLCIKNMVDRYFQTAIHIFVFALVLIKTTETRELIPNSSYLLSLGKTACCMHPLQIWAHEHKCAFMASFCIAVEKMWMEMWISM